MKWMVGSDEACVSRARAGDQDAFRDLVERHSRSVFRLAYRLTGNEYDADDVVQETFLRAYRQLDRFESRANFGTWLYRIAANCSFDLMRTRGRHTDHRDVPVSAAGASSVERVAATDPDPDRLVFGSQIQAQVEAALASLSPLDAPRSCCDILKIGRLTRSAARLAFDRTRRSTASSARSEKFETGSADDERIWCDAKNRHRPVSGRDCERDMRHCSDDEFVLFHYGEDEDRTRIQTHLYQCAACRREYDAMCQMLASVTVPVPVRDATYGTQVWRRVQPRLRRQMKESVFDRIKQGLASAFPPWALLRPQTLLLAGAVGVLVILAFVAGRFSSRDEVPQVAQQQVRERILLVAVGDHLERSQSMLVELVNTPDAATVDISSEQRGAEDLVSANRLYRQAALRAGDTAIATLLDDLERVLVDIANGPTELSDAQLTVIRQRIDAQGILFKVQVTEAQVRAREKAVTERRGRIS